MGAEVYAYTAHPRPTPESRRDKAYHVPGLGDPEGTLPARWYSGTTEGEVREFSQLVADKMLASAGGPAFDVKDAFNCFTADTISQYAFGETFGE